MDLRGIFNGLRGVVAKDPPGPNPDPVEAPRVSETPGEFSVTMPAFPRIGGDVASVGLTDAIAYASKSREADNLRLRFALQGMTNGEALAKIQADAARIARDIAQAEAEPFPMPDYSVGDAYRGLADRRRAIRPDLPDFDENRQGNVGQQLGVLLTGALGGNVGQATRAMNEDAARRAALQYRDDVQEFQYDDAARREEAAMYDRNASVADRQAEQMTAREMQAYLERQRRLYRERDINREDANRLAELDLRERIAEMGNETKLTLADQKTVEQRVKNYDQAWEDIGGVPEDRLEEYRAGLAAIESGQNPGRPAGRTVAKQRADDTATNNASKLAVASDRATVAKVQQAVAAFGREMEPILKTGKITEEDALRLNSRMGEYAAFYKIPRSLLPVARPGTTTSQYAAENGLTIRRGMLAVAERNAATAEMNADTQRGKADGTYGGGTVDHKEYDKAYATEQKAKSKALEERTKLLNLVKLKEQALRSADPSLTAKDIKAALAADEDVIKAVVDTEAAASALTSATDARKAAQSRYQQANVPQSGGPDFETFVSRLVRQESGGSYKAFGDVVNGDRAYGKYQIMGNNIPSWSKRHLGRTLTPQQFLNDARAQDVIARGELKRLYDKYGPEGAAKAWYAGEGNARTDSNRKNYASRGGKRVEYPSINEYARKVAGPPSRINSKTTTAKKGRTRSGNGFKS